MENQRHVYTIDELKTAFQKETEDANEWELYDAIVFLHNIKLQREIISRPEQFPGFGPTKPVTFD